MHILLCEDDLEILGYFKMTLESTGCTVTAVSNGYDALQALSSKPFDGVVTDFRMLGGDGGMLSHYCSEHGIPCTVVTGMPEDVVEGYVPEGTRVLDKCTFASLVDGEPNGAQILIAPTRRSA